MEKEKLSFAGALQELLERETQGASKLLKKIENLERLDKQYIIHFCYQQVLACKVQIDTMMDEATKAELLKRWKGVEASFLTICDELIKELKLKSLNDLLNVGLKKLSGDLVKKVQKSLLDIINQINKIVSRYNRYLDKALFGKFDKLEQEILLHKIEDSASDDLYIGEIPTGELKIVRRRKGCIVEVRDIDHSMIGAYYGYIASAASDEDVLSEYTESDVEDEMAALSGEIEDSVEFPHKGKHQYTVPSKDKDKVYQKNGQLKDKGADLLKKMLVASTTGGNPAKYFESFAKKVITLEKYAVRHGWTLLDGFTMVHKFPFDIGADQGSVTSCIRIDGGDHGHPIEESGSKTSFESYLKREWENDAMQKDSKRQNAFKKYLKKIGYGDTPIFGKKFNWDVAMEVGGASYTIGSSSGVGLNCLIDSIGLTLGIKTDEKERDRIRDVLIKAGYAEEEQFLYNDQRVLETILVELGENPNDYNIHFITNSGLVDDWTYHFNDGNPTLYIHNANNVHFSPMRRNDD